MQVIDHMLDVQACPEKPQYGMASGIPLILYKTMFEDVNWQEDTRELSGSNGDRMVLWCG